MDDIGRLIGQLRRAVQVSNQENFQVRGTAVIGALEAKRRERPLPPGSEIATFTVQHNTSAERTRENLRDAIVRCAGTSREASAEVVAPLLALWSGEINAGQAFPAALEAIPETAKMYWVRQLAIAASNIEDRTMLITVLRAPEFIRLRTDARKALRLVDIVTYGPNIELG